MGALALAASFKTVVDLAQSIRGAITDAAVRDRTSELLGLVIGLQDGYLALQAEHGALLNACHEKDKKIMDLEGSISELSKYELKEAAPGTFLYASKPSAEHNEPSHYICPNCREEKKKSILQAGTASHDYTLLECPRCNKDFRVKPIRTGSFQAKITPWT